MTEARRKFWGWGLESETLSEADAGRIARRVASLTALTPGPYTAPPKPSTSWTCPSRGSHRRVRWPRSATAMPTAARATPTASRTRTTSARGDGISPWRRMSSPTPRTRRTSWRCSTGRAMRGLRSFPMARGRPWWGASSPASGTVCRRPHHRLGPPGQGAGDRPGLPRGPHSGRRARARARSPAQAGGAHAPALPAILRLLDPRRLDRHPLRRPLRHALHPHRRVRGEPAHGDAGRHAGKPPPAGLRRRAEPGPSHDRLRRCARHHHRGLDATAGPPHPPRVRRAPLRRLRVGCRGDPRRGPGRALPDQPAPDRFRGGPARGRGRRQFSPRRARIRKRRPSRGRLDEPRAGMHGRPRCRLRPGGGGSGARPAGRCLARGLHPCALRPRGV